MANPGEETFKIYQVTETPLSGHAGWYHIEIRGCDDELHALRLSRVARDEAGHHETTMDLGTTTEGPCDNTCRFGLTNNNRGAFVYVPPAPVTHLE